MILKSEANASLFVLIFLYASDIIILGIKVIVPKGGGYHASYDNENSSRTIPRHTLRYNQCAKSKRGKRLAFVMLWLVIR